MRPSKDMPYHIGCRVRMYPSYRQQDIVSVNDGARRFVYNRLTGYNAELFALRKVKRYLKPVADRIAYLESVLAKPSCICNSAPFLYLPEVDSQAVANAIYDYRKAWKQFRTVPGTSVPTFHKKGYAKSYNTSAHYPKDASRIGDGNVHLTDKDHITIPKLGRVRFKDGGLLAQLFERTCETRIGQITVSMDACGDYWLSFQVSSMEPFRDPLPETGAVSGYDLNLENFYADSDGNIVPNPRFRKSAQPKIAKLQKKRSRQAEAAKRDGRKLSDSKNYLKTRLRLAQTHRLATRQREDYQHVCSKREVENQDFLFFEDLKVRNLLRNHCLASAISDVGWSEFLRKVQYKAELYGKVFATVPPHYTSQTCSSCGYVLQGSERLSLAQRDFVCPACGTYQIRDVNAAVNVRDRGLVLPGL